MDAFQAALWATILLGLLAVGLPAYWLVSSWWQDRSEPEASSPGAVPLRRT